MQLKLTRRGGVLGIGLGTAVALLGATSAAATTTAAAGQGSAYAAQVSVNVDAGSYGPQGFIVDTGKLGASSTAGPTEASTVSAGMQGLVSAKVFTSSSHFNQASGEVVSKAALVRVSLPMLKASIGTTGSASVISSQCRSTRSGISGSADLVDVDLGKLGTISKPMPNLQLGVPGVVQITANEQVHNPDGSLTVNALHIRFLAGAQTYGMASGDVVLSSSTCGPAVAAVTPPTTAPTTAPTVPTTAPIPSSAPPAPTAAPTTASATPPTTSTPPQVKVIPVGPPQTGDGSLATVVVD